MENNLYYQDKALTYGVGQNRMRKMLGILTKYQGRRILDAGCARGLLGKILRQNGNYVMGWDVSSQAVRKARKVLDEAMVVDLEADCWPRVGKFDLIICSELIEHLFTPELVTQKLVRYLRPKGQILITTPSILYFVNRIKFLFGVFHYEKKGMFDESHIHFFARTTLLRMLLSLGLKVVGENNVFFPKTLSPLLNRWPNLFSQQVVILAEKNHYEN